MDHNNPKRHQQGSTLLTALMFSAIILSLILTSQILILRKNYASIYSKSRLEQSFYNTYANISNSLYNYITNQQIGLPGEYNSNNQITIGSATTANSIQIQSRNLDARAQLQMNLQQQLRTRNNRANIVLIIDQSGSTAVNNFTASQYNECLSFGATHCTCLLDNPISCEPFASIRTAISSTFFNYLNNNVTNPSATITHIHQLINRLTIFITPNNLNNTNYIQYPSPAIDYDHTDRADYINFINTNYILPSRPSPIGHVTDQLSTNASDFFPEVNNTYNFVILISDGGPTSHPSETDCTNDYTSNNDPNICSNVRSRIISDLDILGACIIPIGYGEMLQTTNSKFSQSAFDFITSQLPGASNNCPSGFDLIPSTPAEDTFVIITDPNQFQPAIANIVDQIQTSLNSVIILRQAPIPTLIP